MLTDNFSSSVDRYDRQAVLNTELCLVTADSKHLLVAYSVTVSDGGAILYRIITNNEALTPTTGNIEHTSILVYDLKVCALFICCFKPFFCAFASLFRKAIYAIMFALNMMRYAQIACISSIAFSASFRLNNRLFTFLMLMQIMAR